MENKTLYIAKRGDTYVVGPIKHTYDGGLEVDLNATAEQIHSALVQNGWVRSHKSPLGKDEGVRGVYVHSANWPLDQSAEPLVQYYVISPSVSPRGA